MTQGPLGGPRPFSSASIELILPAGKDIPDSQRQVESRIEDILECPTVMSNLSADEFDFPLESNRAIVISTNVDELRLEQLTEAFRYLSDQMGGGSDRDFWYVATTGEKGPLGTPRPIARSSVCIHCHSNDERTYLSEVAIEGALQDATGMYLEAVEWEGMNHAGPSVTIIFRTEQVGISLLNTVEEVIDELADGTIAASATNITVK